MYFQQGEWLCQYFCDKVVGKDTKVHLHILYLIPSVIALLIYTTAAEYCKKLKSERSQMQKEADILKQEISSLNHAIRYGVLFKSHKLFYTLMRAFCTSSLVALVTTLLQVKFHSFLLKYLPWHSMSITLQTQNSS